MVLPAADPPPAAPHIAGHQTRQQPTVDNQKKSAGPPVAYIGPAPHWRVKYYLGAEASFDVYASPRSTLMNYFTT